MGCGPQAPAPIAPIATPVATPTATREDPTLTTRPAPRATAIAAGVSHTCALLADAGVACWGLAAGGTLGEDVDEADRRRSRPRRVPGVTGGALAAGFRATCAVDRDATMCWGENLQFMASSGPAVGGTTTPKPFPGLADARALGLAAQLSCAVAADAALVCWGEGVSSRPRAADNLARFNLPGGAKAVASAGGHACAVATGGGVYCFGANESGQLGVGDTKARQVPTQVLGLAGVDQVATAFALSCAVHAEGLSCWGGYHCPGHGDCGVQDVASPRPRPIDGLGRVKAVVLRQQRAVVLRTDGSVAETDIVAAFHTGRAAVTVLAGLQGVTALTAGNDHVCALVADGRILCWGANHSGELGDGTLTSRETPAPVDLGAVEPPSSP